MDIDLGVFVSVMKDDIHWSTYEKRVAQPVFRTFGITRSDFPMERP
jgi:hypothetical protein